MHPRDYVSYAALRGDPSDNLPGIPGVGEKTAAKLVNTYGDLDGIFAHVDEQSPKLRANLIENEARARSNVEMMRLVRDVPLGVEPADLRQGEIDTDAVLELFKLLEFPSLVPRLAEAFPDAVRRRRSAHLGPLGGRGRGHRAGNRAGNRPQRSRTSPGTPSVAVAGAWEGEPGRSPLVGIALVTDPVMGGVLYIDAVAPG